MDTDCQSQIDPLGTFLFGGTQFGGTLFGYKPRSGIAHYSGRTITNFLRKQQVDIPELFY